MSVIIATYGAESWARLACERAEPSAERAVEEYGAGEIIRCHPTTGPDTLAHSRNVGAREASGRWLCFLDADDQLAPDYLCRLLALQPIGVDGWRDDGLGLRVPAVSYDGAPPVTFADRNMATMNPCVIGTLIRRDVFHEVGGFWSERAWEDWSLFRRAWLLRERIVHIPGAVYHASVSTNGRNSTVRRPRVLHREIIESHDRWMAERRDLTAVLG